ncbi:ICAM5 protein, partial [Serilophus lunatus]|nr:ICAM5 protein [Serilophus lunatus]
AREGGTRGGAARARGSRVVSRADAGRYVCRATNRHGVATRNVVVTVEYEPSIGEPGCPERRLWLEGTPAQLGCAATGNPPPHVTCAKVGDTRDHPPVTPKELGDTRDHPSRAGGHPGDPPSDTQCHLDQAGGHPWSPLDGPAAVTLRVLPSANVTRGTTFSLDCGSEGVPAPTYTWALPPAPNLRLAPDNRSLLVTGATTANGGLYTCTATNRHGRSSGSVLVRVDESWLVALVALGSLGAVTVLGLAVAGGYYLKTTACKKGEYNVRDAEGSSSEAACLHRQRPRHDRGEVFGIQLTQP